jgi:hypothetical protein
LTTTEFRKDRILWRFAKSGGNGLFTRPFSDAQPNVVAEIHNQVAMMAGESPILLSYREESQWVLLTSERFLWRKHDSKKELAHRQIADATISPAILKKAGSELSIEDLDILTVAGEKHSVTIEAGPPLFGFWNALKMIASLHIEKASPGWTVPITQKRNAHQ